jgi:predicted house-cleaning noncanonical NTP pyrophosphatase (MazG superfamily)
MKYNKLIRSKVPGILDAKNIPYKICYADDEEYMKKLYEKLLEEAMEFIKDPHNQEELADILEVIETIKKANGWSTQEIEQIRLKKLQSHGGFEEPIILIES